PGGEPLRLQALLFRTTAGLLFALLFVIRGFGITVGTHAAYDVLILTAA
ncbi:MAG: CPBP family intramembrane metalloprotease, partial [Planctomycetota bacterium]